MNSRLAALAARRRDLQAECELQRDDVRQLYAGLEQRTARVDRVMETVRRLAPVLVIGGCIAMVAFGPRRIVGLVRRSLPLATMLVALPQTARAAVALLRAGRPAAVRD